MSLENIFLDLRGLITPITSRKHYLMFFNWFYPDYMSILIKGVQAWSSSPPLVLLKFLQEFVHNKNQRLNLDSSSANSILLFRDVSQILCSFGESSMLADTSKNAYDDATYKGISICFDILTRCLSGNYINFGVFWLYNDNAIHAAFSMMIQMFLHVPLADMMTYPKLAVRYFALLETFSSEQMYYCNNQLSPEAFLYIIQSCKLGIESDDTRIRGHACAIILHVCSFVSNNEKKKRVAWVLEYYFRCYIVPQLLTHVFGLVLFADHQDVCWQLSRPLYALVLLDRNV